MSSVVLCTAGYDHSIRFWEATSGICYRTLQYVDSQVNKLEITNDKQFIAAAGNQHIRLFDVNSNDPQPTFSYDGHVGNVTAVGFQKDSKWMYSGGGEAGWRAAGLHGLHANAACTAILQPRMQGTADVRKSADMHSHTHGIQQLGAAGHAAAWVRTRQGWHSEVSCMPS